MEEQKNILELISRINERNLQKYQASGITVYVLISALVFVGYRILTLIPDVYNTNLYDAAVIAMITSTIFLGISLIISAYRQTISYKRPFKVIYSKIEHLSILEIMNLMSFVFFPYICSLYLTFNFWTTLQNKWYFLTFDILFTTLALLIAIGFTYSKAEKKIGKISKFEESGSPYKESSPLIMLCYFIGASLITMSIICSSNIAVSQSTESIKDIVEISILFVTIPLIIDFIIDKKNTSLRNRALEDLEIEIYLNNLSHDQIINRLEEKYLGIGLSNWMSRKKKEYTSELSKTQDRFDSIKKVHEDLKGEISNFDEPEYNSNLQIVRESFSDLKSEVYSYYSDLFDEIDFIWARSYYNDLSDLESDQLEEFITEFNINFDLLYNEIHEYLQNELN